METMPVKEVRRALIRALNENIEHATQHFLLDLQEQWIVRDALADAEKTDAAPLRSAGDGCPERR